MKKTMKITMAVWALCVLSLAGLGRETDHKFSKVPNTIVLEWNEIAYEAFGGRLYQHSLMASRINAMTHLAMHDALNAVYAVYETYAFNSKNPDADPVVAAAAAAHAVLLHEIPARKGFLDSALQQSLKNVPEGEGKIKGLELGEQAAQAVLAARANDGAAGEVMGKIALSDVAGKYQAVPPFNIVFAPHWQNVTPFGLQSKNQFRCAPQPALNSDEYAAGFNEVKENGKLASNTRSAEQTAYAKFWYEFSEAGWNRVARTVAKDKNLNLFETARLFALVDMALADAYIAGWDSKLHYDFWRPYTAIRGAASDGNDATAPDEAWQPSEPTPPVQDYPSTHSALGNAAARVLAKLLGDNTSFTFSSPTALPERVTRSFDSFSKAADENADSRVQAGIHFRFSCKAGQELGNKIGDWVVENHLKELK